MKNLVKKIASTAFTLIELLVVMAIIAILVSIALPVFVGILERGQQTKDLSNAKQIGLGLKLYAGDNDGQYPASVQANGSESCIAQLIPIHPDRENFLSGENPPGPLSSPDEVFTDSQDTLKAGENNFAYVNDLTDTSNPNYPIIADGFAALTPGTYTSDETPKAESGKARRLSWFAWI